jgi:ubiquinone/menaquinone biosynthesis C-methylase UbiE
MCYNFVELMAKTTDNFRKHTTRNPLQRFFIDRFLDVLVKELRKIHPKTVLDVGCGEGFTLARIRKADIGKHLEGVDFLDTAIALGKKAHPYLSLKQGTIYKLPYKDNSFDVVLCTEVLEHLDNPEKAVAELHRVTRRYGIISVPNEPIFRIANFVRGKNWSRWGNDIEHIQHWSTKGIIRFVSKYFTVRVVRTPFPWTMLVVEK